MLSAQLNNSVLQLSEFSTTELSQKQSGTTIIKASSDINLILVGVVDVDAKVSAVKVKVHRNWASTVKKIVSGKPFRLLYLIKY